MLKHVRKKLSEWIAAHQKISPLQPTNPRITIVMPEKGGVSISGELYFSTETLQELKESSMKVWRVFVSSLKILVKLIPYLAAILALLQAKY